MTKFRVQSAFNERLRRPGSATRLSRLRREMEARKVLSTRDDVRLPPMAAPLLLDREQSAYLRHASERLVALLTTELGRYVPHEPDLLDALRIGAELRPFLRDALSTNVTVARCDFLWSAEGWKVVEVNIGGAVGGLDVLDYNELAEADPAIGPFLREHGLSAGSPIAALADAALAACARLGTASSRPVLAIVDSPTYEPLFHLAHRTLARHYAARGFRVVIRHQRRLSLRDGHLYADDTHVDLVHRQFIIEDMLEEPAAAVPVFEAARAGNVAIVTGFREEFLGGKGMLAILRAAAERGVLPADDARLMRAVVPETYLLHRPAGRAFAGSGDGHDRLRHPGAAREWVVKPSIGSSGGEVTLGPAVNDETFQAAVAAATVSNQAWVAQRYVPSDLVDLPFLQGQELTFRGCQIHPSFFVTQGRTTGAWTRVVPGRKPGLIAMANGALYGGVFLED
ncbi:MULTISPECIES: circularly permuted type 2 ATP-grasp protein [Micromonospora]|uniref:circularly permuted type 2 ATP-grasp protein n=1 Tax=Micromonospora TaxID=1873 RepID=UPI000A875F1D|nr:MULTISPECIES: circularly permuted type 2 ATP-grasp protein [Micromonospora]